MKIEALDIYVLEVPLNGKIFNPRILWKRKQSVIIRIQSSSGHVGWGECWCFDQSADALVRFIQTEVKPYILSLKDIQVTSVWNELWSNTCLSGRHGMMASALSGVDIALHDLISKIGGVTLGESISCAVRDSVPVYASAGLYRVNDSIERIREEFSYLKSIGHQTYKMKFGALSIEEDFERISAVRDVIGKDSELIIDAVYSLDRDKAIKWLPLWRELNIGTIQAPFPAQNWKDMTWLNQECGIKTMVFESESRIEVFRALMNEKAIGVLQFSPIAVGGITGSLKLLELAREFEIEVSIQCSSTWVAESVALELARSHMEIKNVELHYLHKGLFDLIPENEVKPENGFLKLHKRTGIGFHINEEAMTQVNSTLIDS